MPIFISYSHQDKDFVDRLAANLVRHKARVWVDRWELNVGDSIIDRIQEAIQESSALIIVISTSSMESEWCKKELSSGFLRELEERRVVVLPLLLEDCEMPIFLRGKMYADFRSSFDEGLKKTLEAIAKVTSDTQGRSVEQPDFYTDWSMEWGFTENGLYVLRFTVVDHGKDVPYVVLTEIGVFANEAATERYKMHADNGQEWLGRYPIILTLGEFAEQNKNLQIVLEDSFPKKREFRIQDTKLGFRYDVLVTSRWLGEDTGKNVLIDFGNHLILVKEHMKRTIRDFPTSYQDVF
jgi:hypothetical protein